MPHVGVHDGRHVDAPGEHGAGGGTGGGTGGDGPHVVEARIDWCGSQPLTFNSQAGELSVNVRSALRGWRVMLAGLYVIFNRRGYLIVELQHKSGD